MVCIELLHRSVLGIYISEDKNILVAENSLDLLLQNIENILCIQMEVLGIQKHVMS